MKKYAGGDIKSINAKLVIYNIIIAVIAIACAVSLYVGTFWKIAVSYQVSEDIMKSLLSPSGEENLGENSDIFANIDFAEIASEAKFELGISLSPTVLLGSINGDSKTTVTNALRDASAEILDNVDKIIKNIIKVGAKLAVNMAINEVNESIEAHLDELPPEAANIDLSGINDIVDKMLSDEATPEEIKGDLVALTNEQIDNLPDLSAEQKVQLKQEASQGVGEMYDNLVEEFGDENGAIKPTQIVMSVIGDSMGMEVGDESSNSDLPMMISQNIVSSISDSTINGISSVIKGIGIFLGIVIAAWVLLALMAILRIFTRKKGVSLSLARFLGWMPYVFFVGIPMLIILLLPKLLASSGVSEYARNINNYTKGLSLTFESTTYLSALGTVALMFINIFGYKRLKKQAKYA